VTRGVLPLENHNAFVIAAHDLDDDIERTAAVLHARGRTPRPCARPINPAERPHRRGLTVLSTAGSAISPHAITFGELPGYVGADGCPTMDHLGCNAFWLTVRGGSVVAIDEQYSP
jgi:hypothetical protein